MNIYLSIWLFVKVTISSLTTFNIFPNENIFLQQMIYEINVNNEKFDEQNINDLNIELLKEIKLENEQIDELNGNERLFSFHLDKSDDIDIILLRNRSIIECLYQFKNYIQDDDIIMKKKYCQIKLNNSDCFQLYKLDQEIYIVQCYFNQNNTIIQILNQSQIFDQIVIPIEQQCQSDSIFQKNTIIIFNKNCVTSIFYSIQIFNLSFSDIKRYNLSQIEGFSENNQQIIQLEFSSPGDIFIIQTNQVSVLFEKNNQILSVYQNDQANILKVYPHKSSTLKFIVLENLEKSQLYLEQKQLNFSSVNFKNVFNIRKFIYLFHFTDKLVVTISQYQKVQQINTNNLIQVGKLPLFVAISNQQIILIKLIQPKSIISYKNSDSFLAVVVDPYQFSTFWINLKLFDPNKPIQNFYKKKFFYEITTFNDQICLPYSQYTRNLPIKINKIMENGINLKFFNDYNNQTLSYLNGILLFSKVLILYKISYEKVLIGLIQGNNIFKLIFYVNGEQIKSYIIQLHENIIEIFFLRKNMLLIIIYQNSIEIYRIKQDEIRKSIHQTEKKILKAIKFNFFVLYLLEDCTKVQIQLSFEKFIFVEAEYQFDCKSSFQFSKEGIYIDTKYIYYYHPYQIPQKITFKEQIIQIHNVLTDQLLIFTSYNNEINIKLFQFYQEELFFLYTLPTYNYTVQFPLQYKIQESNLIIKAKKDDLGSFLLIYDLINTAIQSLIQINQIDEVEKFSFDFINDEEYFFIYEKQIHIQNLNQPCFSFQISKESQDFIEEKKLIINTNSFISNENIDLNFHFVRFNTNYTLQLLNINQRILTGTIFNFENIFGNIENVEIIGSENISIYQPLIFKNQSAICSYYRFGICVNGQSIFRNIFDSNTSLQCSYNLGFIIQYINFNNENCNHEFFIIDSTSLVIYEFNFCNNILRHDKRILNYSSEFSNLKITNDLQIVGLSNGSLLFHYQYKPFLDQDISNIFERFNFNTFDVIKIKNSTYTLLNIGLQYFELKVFKLTDIDDRVIYDILVDNKYKSDRMLENFKVEFFYDSFIKIQIYHIENIGNQYQIKFIMVSKDQIAVLMQIVLDLNDLNKIIFEQLGIIRYEYKANFKKLLFIDINFAILCFQQNQVSFINVFDISNLRKNRNIDSIQKVEDNNYTFIERYNESHFILVEKFSSLDLKVHLITLDKFRIECQGQCTQPSYLKLSNQVSQILIELNFENEKEIHKNFVQFIMVVFTFICIFIKLLLSKKEQKKRRKEFFNIENNYN
ncbi:unnamed protein product [Paramecium sonneborni]|uniref:Transmembrane protein n=1 Tax=Paramecium sonneborni TaxID=65129 RepID=A0A8S1RCY3_9CILI|nr:unnamed protein product [Paramecium sonneborni]